VTRRRAVIVALVVILLALGAIWHAVHVARIGREAEMLALCTSAVGRDELALDEAFTRAGMLALRTGAFTTTYSRESSYFQSFACLIELDATQHVRRALVSRLRRQEVWQPGTHIPIWGNVIWPALVRASIPLTP